MKTILLLAWLGSLSADAVTTHRAMHQYGAQELLLPRDDVARGAIFLVQGAAGVVGIHYLWKHDRKKLAVILAATLIGTHSLAAVHNVGVR
jgi:hypothetical protein